MTKAKAKEASNASAGKQESRDLPASNRPESLVFARFAPPSSVELLFGDGASGVYPLEALQIDWSLLRPETIKAAELGSAMEIRAKSGELIRMDSGSIRMLVDEEYAERMDEEVNAISIPPEAMARIVERNRPPQAWYDRG